MIGILDYGVGNVGAFLKIYNNQDIPVTTITSPNQFDDVSKIILPGVGSFDSAMQRLNSSGLRPGLDESVLSKRKALLGICIGMQMLGMGSEEGTEAGLGYIPGFTKILSNASQNDELILPHMGWNNIEIVHRSAIWDGVDELEGFYFLHSYAFVPDRTENSIAKCHYGRSFTCAIELSNIFGCQFHPEKSLSNGLNLLKNFAMLE